MNNLCLKILPSQFAVLFDKYNLCMFLCVFLSNYNWIFSRDIEHLEEPVYSAKAHSQIINAIDGVGGLGIGAGAPEIITGSKDGISTQVNKSKFFKTSQKLFFKMTFQILVYLILNSVLLASNTFLYLCKLPFNVKCLFFM